MLAPPPPLPAAGLLPTHSSRPAMPFPRVPTPPVTFPTYLVLSPPFRSRHSSNASSSSTTSTHDADSIDSSTSAYLPEHTSHLRCARCAADLAASTQIISKGFTGRHGRAYLVGPSGNSNSSGGASVLPDLPNTYTHKPVPRQLVTGAHTVGDISCAQCGAVLGWKYVGAEEEAQRYKVGKFILETKRVCRSSTWEEGGGDELDVASRWRMGRRLVTARRRGSFAAQNPQTPPPAPIEFDSQDEDECEDLFLGVWTPQLAAKRRRQKRFNSRIVED